MALLLRLMIVFLAAGSYAGEAERIADRLLAPCCWRESVRVHRSPQAEELRRDIAARLEMGQSEDEILTAYVAKYGSRILRDPPGAKRAWLDAMPVAALGLGLWFLVRFVKSSLSARSV